MRLFQHAPAAALAAGMIALAGCAGDPVAPVDLSTVQPSLSLGLPNGATADTLVVGETVQLSAASLPKKKGRTTATATQWTSSAPEVATVTQAGLVKAVAPGATTVTASNNLGSERATILVQGAPAAAPAPTPSAQTVLAFVGPTQPVADVEALGGEWAKYEQYFRTYSEQLWSQEGASYTGNYYDRASIYYTWWARTGNRTYYDRATAMALDYRTKQVEPANYQLEPRDAQLDGLALHYLLTGDEASRTAIGRLADWYAGAGYYGRIGDTTSSTDGRSQARVLMSFVTAAYVGAPSSAGNDWPTMARGALQKILGTQSADGGYRFRIHCYYNKPFMNGMVNDAMVRYFRLFEADARILPSVKKSVDYMWTRNWVPEAQAFVYMEGECTEGPPSPAADGNLLTLTGYGWVGRQTGDRTYFERGDAIFKGGVNGAWFGGTKHFNQQFTHSYRYFGTRF